MTMPADLSTRDRLIQAAISIIETEGEAGVRVDQVAALAGFTKPEFGARLEEAIASFADPESRHQRGVRSEVMGSSVSRPDLRDAVVLANRVYISGLAAEVDIEDRESSEWVNITMFSVRQLLELSA